MDEAGAFDARGSPLGNRQEFLDCSSTLARALRRSRRASRSSRASVMTRAIVSPVARDLLRKSVGFWILDVEAHEHKFFPAIQDFA